MQRTAVYCNVNDGKLQISINKGSSINDLTALVVGGQGFFDGSDTLASRWGEGGSKLSKIA